jgi:hypothetical protein
MQGLPFCATHASAPASGRHDAAGVRKKGMAEGFGFDFTAAVAWLFSLSISPVTGIELLLTNDALTFSH